MRFNIAVQRALIGNDLDIQIDADGDEQIVKVIYNLDGFDLANDDYTDNPVVSSHRTFSQAGDAGPKMLHKLIVQVQGSVDQPTKSGARVWNDSS